jgi:REP element-mobilizing transposase RayT
VPQSFGAMYVHAIFSTKHREPTILDPWRDELFRVLGGLVNQSGSQSLLVGGVADHVHLLFRLSRTVTIADTMLAIKKRSSAWVNQRPETVAKFHWQAGYGAFSVSDDHLETVREYIRRQPEHHQKQTYQDEFREWLTRYHEEWDERYVWD